MSDPFPRRLVGYLAARPWLLAFLVAVGGGLALLAVTGNLWLQGNGRVTVYEWGTLLVTLALWLGAWLFFRRDLTEELVLGWVFGIQWEFLTEPYWTYLPDKFNVVAWHGKDVPVLALVGWGAVFALTMLLTDWLGKRLLGKPPAKLLFDWRVLLIDAAAIQVVGTAAEWFLGIHLGCWQYNLGFGIGTSPLGLGWEVHIGYMIVMFWYGTTYRVWKLRLEGAL